MPEATTLYVMTAVVVAGLLAWVSVVLATVKTPWARGPLDPLLGLPSTEYRGVVPADRHAIDGGSAMTTGGHVPLIGGPSVDADETARATPVALSEGKARAVTATVGAATTTFATAPDGSSLGLQDLRVGWTGAEGAGAERVRRTKEEARIRADEALAKLRAGEDFLVVQREYDDPRPTEATRTTASFPTALALALNETSSVIETDAGFCIVKRVAAKNPVDS